MTTFETIILIVLYSFAFAYTAYDFGIRKCDIFIVKLLIVLAATIGVLCFPIMIAEDIWKKLNNKEENNESK